MIAVADPAELCRISCTNATNGTSIGTEDNFRISTYDFDHAIRDLGSLAFRIQVIMNADLMVAICHE